MGGVCQVNKARSEFVCIARDWLVPLCHFHFRNYRGLMQTSNVLKSSSSSLDCITILTIHFIIK
jgi:hypothetical protein